MHARVVNAQIQPGKMDDAIRVFRDSVVPAAKQQKGFKSILFLTDRNGNKAVTLSVWETEADLKANEASGYYQEQIAKFASIFVAPPARDAFEVSVQA